MSHTGGSSRSLRRQSSSTSKLGFCHGRAKSSGSIPSPVIPNWLNCVPWQHRIYGSFVLQSGAARDDGFLVQGSREHLQPPQTPTMIRVQKLGTMLAPRPLRLSEFFGGAGWIMSRNVGKQQHQSDADYAILSGFRDLAAHVAPLKAPQEIDDLDRCVIGLKRNTRRKHQGQINSIAVRFDLEPQSLHTFLT
ncbi:hypothetical protein VTK73DRAFT_3433 [Phialemonium thermophilum]|uniref:Uncharacterized protein n=1 Tax=Phialemonium thermophilum TaxID=223376 RepID=A0ABR3VL59_9PEZI